MKMGRSLESHDLYPNTTEINNSKLDSFQQFRVGCVIGAHVSEKTSKYIGKYATIL